MTSLEKLQELKIIGISDGEVAMPVFYNKNIQDSKYFYNCNVISMAATIARTIDKDALFRGIFYDVSMKRTNEDEKPSAVYAIGKALYNNKTEYGIWQIETANINRTDLLNVGWQLVARAPDKFIDAAIAFDGVWKLNNNFKYYSLFTEEFPWAFYVNKNNELYRWNCFTREKYQLDTNVNYCAAERGYYPEGYTDINSDQGVIVVYATKNQEVKYFTYSYISNGTKQWLGPETIVSFTGESIKSLQVHRLNDYRVGVLVVTNKKSYWYITDRVYSQMAFKPEWFKLETIQQYVPLHIAIAINTEMPLPEFEWKINNDKTVITAICNMPIKLYNDINLIKLFSGSDTMPMIQSITCIDNIITFNLATAAKSTFTLSQIDTTVDFAAEVTNDFGASGRRCISDMQHTFEIFLSGYDKEKFELHDISIKTAKIKCTSRKYVIHHQKEEHFKLQDIIIKKASIKCTARKYIYHHQKKEEFNLCGITIKKATISVTGTSVKPI